jgi:membrane protease YdiL (CAAX protease family)
MVSAEAVGGPVRYPLARPVLRNEVLLVLGVSLGVSAAYSIVSFIAKLTAPAPLSSQTTALNTSAAPGRPWLDLTYQLLGVLFNVVPALLALHLLRRDRHGVLDDLGLDPLRSRRRPWFDLGWGVALTAAIGLPGLALYVVMKALGLNTVVAAANLPDIWWAAPVLVLAAVGNAVVEEVVVVGYLLTRLRDLRVGIVAAVAVSALLRGSYHLYQGPGGFLGNAVMGVVFALFFLRTKRLLPLIIAHTLLDVVAYLGYTLLRDDLDFLR